jgi:hypothetical protein
MELEEEKQNNVCIRMDILMTVGNKTKKTWVFSSVADP